MEPTRYKQQPVPGLSQAYGSIRHLQTPNLRRSGSLRWGLAHPLAPHPNGQWCRHLVGTAPIEVTAAAGWAAGGWKASQNKGYLARASAKRMGICYTHAPFLKLVQQQMNTPDHREFRSVKSSQIVLKELMIPSYANFGGKVHGGIILSLMDKIAYTCAASHSRSYCVTASVDSVDFLNPVEVGELVTLNGSINYVGRSSMEVGIKVLSEDFKKGIIKHTNTSYFTMVAIDEVSRKPVAVPGLILEDETEIKRFIWGKFRKQYKRDYQDRFNALREKIDITRETANLNNENCVIKF